MKAIEILKNNETIFLVEGINGKAKNLAEEINNLFKTLNNTITDIESFKNDQLNGNYNRKIYMSKSLNTFFGPNKFLKLESVIDGYEKAEKAIIDNFYVLKSKLLNSLNALIKESNKTAVVSKYDLFEDNLTPCQEGHEVIILGGRNLEILNNILTTLDAELNIEGNFNNVHSRVLDYDKTTLLANVDLCNQRANSLFSSKQNRLTKIVTVISKLKEVSNRVVAFYTYKDELLFVGCPEKGVRDYENSLAKEYIPLKKLVEKELKVELRNICDVQVNENDYPVANEDLGIAQETPTENEYSQAETINEPETMDNIQAENNVFEAQPTYDDYPQTTETVATENLSTEYTNETPTPEFDNTVIEETPVEETTETPSAPNIDELNKIMQGFKNDNE